MAIGVAGAGKTTLLTPLVEAWQQEGRDVWGAARNTGPVTCWPRQESRRSTSQRSTRSSGGFRDGRIVLTERSVVVLDEISQIGTRDLLALLQLHAQHGFSIVAVGDPMQSQAIEAGAVIGLLERAFADVAPIPTLDSSVRQKRPRDRRPHCCFGRAGRGGADPQTRGRHDAPRGGRL